MCIGYSITPFTPSIDDNELARLWSGHFESLKSVLVLLLVCYLVEEFSENVR